MHCRVLKKKIISITNLCPGVQYMSWFGIIIYNANGFNDISPKYWIVFYIPKHLWNQRKINDFILKTSLWMFCTLVLYTKVYNGDFNSGHEYYNQTNKYLAKRNGARLVKRARLQLWTICKP